MSGQGKIKAARRALNQLYRLHHAIEYKTYRPCGMWRSTWIRLKQEAESQQTRAIALAGFGVDAFIETAKPRRHSISRAQIEVAMHTVLGSATLPGNWTED
jgi:hypothetical protein